MRNLRGTAAAVLSAATVLISISFTGTPVFASVGSEHVPDNWFYGTARIVGTDYNYDDRTVTIHVVPVDKFAVCEERTGEDVVDLNHRDGVVDFVSARYGDVPVTRIAVDNVDPLSPWRPFHHLTTAMPSRTMSVASTQPVASSDASRWTLQQAIVQVAQGQLGVGYIWGHSPDHGQYGFDSGNFTAFVYRHALGFSLSAVCREQADVGISVPVSAIEPGDLVVFDGGLHTGIYTGNHQVIQAGGGLGHVGYLSIAPDNPWASRISDVRRLV